MSFKFLPSLSIAALALTAAASAQAHGAADTATSLAAYTPHTLSRAEVIADLEVYRRSGLAALDAQDSPNVYGSDYLQAQARYQALRHDPAFQARVAMLARERGETAMQVSAAR
ncbi:MAG: DUF4148 domain-containing protein [Roseateles sp.]|nr:MAG: DUF4148 domain-containing protein [Roseateles sp.]